MSSETKQEKTLDSMARLREAYAIKSEAAENGVVISGFPGGATFTCRYLRSFKVRAFNTAQARKLRQAIQSGGGLLEPEQSDRADLETLVNAVLVGWSGIVDEKGVAIPFSIGAARTLFGELPELMREVLSYAGQAETYRAASLEAAVGN